MVDRAESNHRHADFQLQGRSPAALASPRPVRCFFPASDRVAPHRTHADPQRRSPAQWAPTPRWFNGLLATRPNRDRPFSPASGEETTRTSRSSLSVLTRLRPVGRRRLTLEAAFTAMSFESKRHTVTANFRIRYVTLAADDSACGSISKLASFPASDPACARQGDCQ